MTYPLLAPILAGLTAGGIALAVGFVARRILHRRRRRRALAELAAAQAAMRRRVAIRRPDPVHPLDGYDIVAEANAVVAAAWREERA